MRFTLQSLVIGITYVAIGCAGLANPTEPWVSVVVTLTVVTILVAAVVSIFGHGKKRAFLGGFAFSNVAYLASVFAPGSSDNIAPYLATTKVLDWANQKLHGDDFNVISVAFSPNGSKLATSINNNVKIWNVSSGNIVTGNIVTDQNPFIQIGHCLCALIIGCVAGILAQYYSVRTHSDTKATTLVH